MGLAYEKGSGQHQKALNLGMGRMNERGWELCESMRLKVRKKMSNISSLIRRGGGGDWSFNGVCLLGKGVGGNKHD